MARSARKRGAPDLGVLAVQLLRHVQAELFAALADQGYLDVRPRHGAVMAYLEEDGVRLSELVELTGRNKQTLGAIVDELEALGYLDKIPDPTDRRARLIVPTGRGLMLMRATDRAMAALEAAREHEMGADAYHGFKQALARLAGAF